MVNNNKINLNKNYKYKFILIILILIITINITVKKFYATTEKKDIKYSSDIINYKGKKVLKVKLLDEYLLKISDDYKSDKDIERYRINKYFNSLDYKYNLDNKSYLKKIFLKEISKLKKQSINEIETFFFSNHWNFGNNFIIISNTIFYCEVIGCHKIILNNQKINRRWLIINPVHIEKFNITIMQGSNVDCQNKNILCINENSLNIFFEPNIIIPQVRSNLIKSEILKNLPQVNIEPESLYIHIRGGDIFQSSPSKYYAQPPLCFYEKILNISLLCHAYNIVLSVSSFALSAIKLNDNLKNIWEYDMMKLSQKLVLLHHDIYNFPIKYTIHIMIPSDNYNSKMFSWKRSPEQIKLMIEENCPFDFRIYK